MSNIFQPNKLALASASGSSISKAEAGTLNAQVRRIANLQTELHESWKETDRLRDKLQETKKEFENVHLRLGGILRGTLPKVVGAHVNVLRRLGLSSTENLEQLCSFISNDSGGEENLVVLERILEGLTESQIYDKINAGITAKNEKGEQGKVVRETMKVRGESASNSDARVKQATNAPNDHGDTSSRWKRNVQTEAVFSRKVEPEVVHHRVKTRSMRHSQETTEVCFTTNDLEQLQGTQIKVRANTMKKSKEVSINSCSSHGIVKCDMTFFECHCGKSFNSEANILRHISMSLSYPAQFECNVCKTKFWSREEFIEHSTSAHKPQQQPKPRKSTADDSANIKHEAVANSEELACVCGLKFASRTTLWSHVKRFTLEKKFQCDICAKPYCWARDLRHHMKTVHQLELESDFGCSSCGNFFESLSELIAHRAAEHPKSQKNFDSTIVKVEQPERNSSPGSDSGNSHEAAMNVDI